MIDKLADAAWDELERQSRQGEMPYVDREMEIVDGAIDMRALVTAIIDANRD